MQRKPHFARGERLTLDYTADTEEVIWGILFSFGDVIDVTLGRDVSLLELRQQMDGGGPWAWGAFATEWIQDIAATIEACDRMVFSTDKTENGAVERTRSTAPAHHRRDLSGRAAAAP